MESDSSHWSRWRRVVRLAPGEGLAAAGSFFYFLFVLASYYTLRPLRDALAVETGVENIQYLFLATFIAMLAIVPLYGWVVSKIQRRVLLPVVYVFFIVNILAFRAWFLVGAGDPWLARVFFVWVSVFNLFVVSVFWSFMADLWRTDQAKRLYGLIAAGGSVGAVAGPLLTSTLAASLGLPNLLLVSAALLTAGLACLGGLLRLARERSPGSDDPTVPMGGEILAGARLMISHGFLGRVAAIMFLGTLTGSMLYMQQARIVDLHFETATEVTGVFARIDLAVNLLTIAIQVALTARILGWLGIAVALALLPALATVGFAAITFAPLLGVIVGVQVLRRGVLFAITNPVSQLIYTAVGPQAKYKFKHFCDTVVYRAGDTAGSWLFTGVMATGAGLAAAAASGMLIAAGWTAVAYRVGREFVGLTHKRSELP